MDLVKQEYGFMPSTLRTPYFVGYHIQLGVVLSGNMVGRAQIDGVDVEHVLARSIRPHLPLDIGRDQEGDLVWISESNGCLPNPPVILDFGQHEFPHANSSEEKLEIENKSFQLVRSKIPSLVSVLAKPKPYIYISGLIGIALIFLGLSFTAEGPGSSKPADVVANAQAEDPAVLLSPEEAALNFVTQGDVPGINAPEGLTEDALSAVVVSRSGEIVLVDIHLMAEGGLTTFATLLLQKTGTTWRIREVYDSR